jgi:DNA polymerase type B, organellar and viral
LTPTATLSLKIFRTKILQEDIPILKGLTDNFIRKAYYGGRTDYYKAYATNLKYYDINSLYPFALTKPLPFEMKKYHPNLTDLNLNNFFGYLEVEVTCPDHMEKPVLPYHNEGKTIYPTGTWIGVYLSFGKKNLKLLKN